MRFAFFLLLLLPTVLHASGVDPCASRFAQLTQLYRQGFKSLLHQESETAANLKRIIRSGFRVDVEDVHGALAHWERWDDLALHQRELLTRLPNLDAKEREELLQLVHATQATNETGKKFRRMVLLGLYDKPTWGGLVSSITEGNHTAHLAGNYLPALDAHFPAELKEEFLQALGARYPDLTKEKIVPKTALAPKRLADFYFKKMLGADDLISREIARGRNPAQAFEAYTRQVQGYVKGDDLFSAEQALETIRRVQASLKKKVENGFKGPEGEEPFMLIGGSLVNGRANTARSDMDVITNIPFPDLYQTDLERMAQNYVRKLNPDSDFHLSFQKGYKPDLWHKVQPVVFRIRADGIEMMVYDSRGNHRVYKID